MTFDALAFTPLSALAGGVIIGLAVAILLLLNGKIAGISGIASGLLNISHWRTAGWRIAFLAGLILAPSLYQSLYQRPAIVLTDNFATLAVAGLLTGIGIARLSPRSLIATLAFMITGILTVYIVRHVWI